MSNSIGEMSDRARDVFRLVVEAYLDSGHPIGSRLISRTSTLNLSAASIRNVMSDLEQLGLIVAPHTSAGRLPTQLGLRLFVDGLLEVATKVAGSTANIPQLEATAPVLGLIVEEAVVQDGYMNALTDGFGQDA